VTENTQLPEEYPPQSKESLLSRILHVSIKRAKPQRMVHCGFALWPVGVKNLGYNAMQNHIKASCNDAVLNELFLSLYFFAASIKLTNNGAGCSTVLFNSG